MPNLSPNSNRIVAIALFFTALFSAPSLVHADQPNLNRPYEAWVISYEQALEKARATGRPIMLVFTGSDRIHW